MIVISGTTMVSECANYSFISTRVDVNFFESSYTFLVIGRKKILTGLVVLVLTYHILEDFVGNG